MKISRPPLLKRGDKVAIIAPARRISESELAYSSQLIRNNGLTPVYGKALFESDNQYAGNDMLRSTDLQWAINDETIKAVFAARGGYGCMRIVDKIDFSALIKFPKWFIGFSDFTVVLNHILKNSNTESLHAEMPVNFEKYKDSADKILQFLLNGSINYKIISDKTLNAINVSGEMIGGNLSLLYAMQGSISEPDYANKILFLEDLDEYLYHIDRMILSMKRAGKFQKLKAVVVGGFSLLKDNTVPFGKTFSEIIKEHFYEYNIPVFFDFPAGHIESNYPIIIGGKCEIITNATGYDFKQ